MTGFNVGRGRMLAAVPVALVLLAGCGMQPTGTHSQQEAVSAWNALGERHLSDGNALAAGQAFREARTIAPANRQAGAGLARSYHLLGETESAERLFRDVTRDVDAVAEKHYFARYYLVRGRYDHAEPLLASVLENVDYESRTAALVDTGLLALARGSRRVAAACWRRALTREPQRRDALWHLAHVSRLMGADARSADYVRRYARYHAQSVPALRDSLSRLAARERTPAEDSPEGSGEPRCV